ncbi:MAG: hypothetical protein Q9208_003296 [Pyrenodesmia sp. 3 TL-2023]
MNTSIDPYSGRNPSYGFVELASKAQADSAMQELNGKSLLGRPVKLGPGIASSEKRKPTSQSAPRGFRMRPAFDRWTRTDESNHFEGYSDQGRRVWVGGLPKMGSHYAVDADVPRLSAKSSSQQPQRRAILKAWDHRYLFVDFPSVDEARRAISATDSRYAWGVKIRVRPAEAPDSREVLERDEWDDGSSAVQPS